MSTGAKASMEPSSSTGRLIMNEAMEHMWNRYVENNDDKAFNAFLDALCSSSERSTNQSIILSDLPDELLPALSKYLFLGQDEAEQGLMSLQCLSKMRRVISSLCVLSQDNENAPFISSLNIVEQIAMLGHLLLKHLLEMQSAFFVHQGSKSDINNARKRLRDEIMKCLRLSCHFFKLLYDPSGQWEAFLKLLGSELTEDEVVSSCRPRKCNVTLHQSVVPFLYESLDTALTEHFPSLAISLLTVYGGLVSDLRHNCIVAINPATAKMIRKCVNDTDDSDVHYKALQCVLKSMLTLVDFMAGEAQLDLGTLVELYDYILSSLMEKQYYDTVVKGIKALSCMLKNQDNIELSKNALVSNHLLGTLLKIVELHKSNDSSYDLDTFFEATVSALNTMLCSSPQSEMQFYKLNGWSQLFGIVDTESLNDGKIIETVLSMTTYGNCLQRCSIVTAEPLIYLIEVYEARDDKRSEQIVEKATQTLKSKMVCCEAQVISKCLQQLEGLNCNAKETVIVSSLNTRKRAQFLLKLIQELAKHSISPLELNKLIGLLSLPSAILQKEEVMHVISRVARSDGFETCRHFFDLSLSDNKGIEVRDPEHFNFLQSGFAFHCWVRVNTEGQQAARRKRRQLYSLYSSNGNGLEAFFTMDQVLVVAVATKKEYLAVPLTDFPLSDNRWHCLTISHSRHKSRPFGSSLVTIYLDGTRRLECPLKFPSMEKMEHIRVGYSYSRASEDVNYDQLHKQPTFKEGLMDAIKFGIPGVLPQVLKSQTDPRVTWTLVGLEEELWGSARELGGQLGLCFFINDAVSPQQARKLHTMGPNRGLSFSEDDELASKITCCFSPRATTETKGVCSNVINPSTLDGRSSLKTYSTQDIKDSINCIGGVQVLFPLLETAVTETKLHKRDEGEEELIKQNVGSLSTSTDWELLESSSFSDSRLEQNEISGFLTMLKNLITSDEVNRESLMRGGGVAIIGLLMQEASAHDNELIDVNVLMATQLLIELAQSSQDAKLYAQVCTFILLDFDIWSRAKSHVQIGHSQYLASVIKEDRHFFRKRFGVQYLLDVIKKHQSVSGTDEALSNDQKADRQTIRKALINLVQFFLTSRNVAAKDISPVVTFILSSSSSMLSMMSPLSELLQMLLHCVESPKLMRPQAILLLFESRRVDLFYPLLLDPGLSGGLREALLRLLSALLRSQHVATRHKGRMRLQEVHPMGFFDLYFKAHGDSCVSGTELLLLLDQQLIFDDQLSIQAVLALCRQLQWTTLRTKVEVTRRLMTHLFAKPNVPTQFAIEGNWQQAITRLLVKRIITPPTTDETEYVIDVHASDRAVFDDDRPRSRLSSASAKSAVEAAKGVVSSGASSLIDMANDALLRTQGVVHQTKDRVAHHVQELGYRRRRDSADMIVSGFLHTFDLDDDDNFTLLASDTDAMEEESISSSRRLLTPPPGDMEIINENETSIETTNEEDMEEELCQLLIQILFTIMWRGLQGYNENVIRARGEVIACINMLALNHELYRSHVELKKRIIEMSIRAVMSDIQTTNANEKEEVIGLAEHVLLWVYDLVVLEPYRPFDKKVSQSLIEGFVLLLEKLAILDNKCYMASDILLTCCSESKENAVLAMAKLHASVQSRVDIDMEECCYLINRLNDVIKSNIERQEDAIEEPFNSLAMATMKSLLEISSEEMKTNAELPSLNLNRLIDTGTFVEEFTLYCQSEEWVYFIEKKIRPVSKGFYETHLANLSLKMNEFWAECYEAAKMSMQKGLKETKDSVLKFDKQYTEVFKGVVKSEQSRYATWINQTRSQINFVKRRWLINKRFSMGPRGPWNERDDSHTQSRALRRRQESSEEYWKLGALENLLRMRLKMIPHPDFDGELFKKASVRDNNRTLSDGDHKDIVMKLQLSRDAIVQDGTDDEGLSEEELKMLAKEQMETTTADHEIATTGEKLLLTEECDLITLMSKIRGKLELTTHHLYFFDCSPHRSSSDASSRADVRLRLEDLKEVHLRRYNLRRTALELFLIDKSNYLINFKEKRQRNKVLGRLATLRGASNLTTGANYRITPIEVLRASGLTQRWVQRDISNFEYLMRINTIAGRSFNDLSQYPVFPWILADYDSKDLDLNHSKTFRDLSKPMGVQNEAHVEEVRRRYETFDDPSGVIAKFHYGTHYSNSAMVLHYLVRLEPFASLHVELQSGRFDVADRQFHSVAQTWRSLYDNLNDVKELIPEFFYLPEFLKNSNKFDLGRLQNESKCRVDDVQLPNWASSASDFIRKHRLALECEYVSANLHKWIDLVFGYKQRGPEAVKSLNVFYYSTYTGAVNLEAISDPEERQAVEDMINNFGQTPSQLFREAHPRRLSLREVEAGLNKSEPSLKTKIMNAVTLNTTTSRQVEPGHVNDLLFLLHHRWTQTHFDLGLDHNSPIVRLGISLNISNGGLSSSNDINANANVVLAVTALGEVNMHTWLPWDRSNTSASNFSLDIPVWNNKLKGTASNASTRLPRMLSGLQLHRRVVAVSVDGQYLYMGGMWDNSLQVWSVVKNRVVCRVIHHFDLITCLALDEVSGKFLMTGSKDTTSILWHIGNEKPRPWQVYAGHKASVTCVAMAIEMDMAVSGSEDGSVNVYTVKEGQYIRTIWPPTFASGSSGLMAKRSGSIFVLTDIELSIQGQLVLSGHTCDTHSLHVYSVNGELLCSSSVQHRLSVLRAVHDWIICGDENGDLVVRDTFTGRVVKSVALYTPITDLVVTPSPIGQPSHLIVALRDGKLVVVGVRSVQ